MIPANNITVEFTDEHMVKITHKADNGKQVRYIEFNEYVKALSSAVKQTDYGDVEVKDSPILPQFKDVSTIMHRELSTGSQYLVLVREPKPFDITYFESKFNKVGIPKLIFGVKIYSNIIQEVYVVAVKDKIITEKTKIFHYPFSNVSGSNGHICFGGNRISNINVKSLTGLHSVPRMFLAMPNNNDSYGHNKSGLQYRPLLEALEGKKFKEGWLKPLEQGNTQVTYEEWIKNLK